MYRFDVPWKARDTDGPDVKWLRGLQLRPNRKFYTYLYLISLLACEQDRRGRGSPWWMRTARTLGSERTLGVGPAAGRRPWPAPTAWRPYLSPCRPRSHTPPRHLRYVQLTAHYILFSFTYLFTILNDWNSLYSSHVKTVEVGK